MIFQSAVTQKVVQFIKEKYDGELEFLWLKTPQNAVVRHKDSRKWYAAILNIPKQKLGLEGLGNIDIIDLKCDRGLAYSLGDGKNYFPAYHMNKEHWIAIVLDEAVVLEEVYTLIDASYHITKG